MYAKIGRVLSGVLLSGALICGRADAQQRGSDWAGMTVRDVAFIRDRIQSADIYAILGDPSFKRTYDEATAAAVAAAPKTKSLSEYQAVLKRYVGALMDPHASLQFTVAPTGLQWAGFLVRMRGDRYFVVGSQDNRVIDGAEIESCDGKPVSQIADAMALFEMAIPGLQSMRANMARLLTVDAGNPYYRRVSTCTVAGVAVPLQWRPISADALAVLNGNFARYRDPTVWSKPFGAKGVWIHMGIFYAPSTDVADQYHALYAQLPAMRDRDLIVVDVRGNGGGSYNWFMGFLRALYGDDYAAYYARARLKIHPLYADDPAKPDPVPSTGSSSNAPQIEEPLDAPLVRAEGKAVKEKLPNGRYVYRTPPVPDAEDPTSPPPLNPVHARVLLLTDNGCASACIGFADELRRFPGVQQIGADTYVDRLSGTAVEAPLPSGNGIFRVPSMIRYGRQRDDNIPRVPAIRYDGDLSDTAAVQAWIVNSVLKSPAPAAAQGND